MSRLSRLCGLDYGGRVYVRGIRLQTDRVTSAITCEPGNDLSVTGFTVRSKLTTVQVLQRLQLRLEKRMEAQRVKLSGFELVRGRGDKIILWPKTNALGRTYTKKDWKRTTGNPT